jgi:hypothetical protein
VKDGALAFFTLEICWNNVCAVEGMFSVDQTIVGHGLHAMTVRREVVGEQRSCGLMVPVRDDDCPLLVVGVQERVGLRWFVDDDGADQSVNVLVLKVGVPPMSIIRIPEEKRRTTSFEYSRSG